MNFIIPRPIFDAHQALPWDERGLFWEISLPGGIGSTNTHIDRGPRGEIEAQFGGGTNMPLVRLYKDKSRPIDPVLPFLPVRGMRLWSLKDRQCSSVETMRAGTVMQFGAFYNLTVQADGPFPGIPTGGESGSTVWTMHEGRAYLVGQLNYGGVVSLPWWHQALGNGTHFIPACTITQPSELDSDPDFYFSAPRKEIMNTHTCTIIDAHTDPVVIRLSGQGGDEWRFPHLPPYWPIHVDKTGDDYKLTWDKSMTDGRNYMLICTLASGYTFTSELFESGSVISATAGNKPEPDTDIIEKPSGTEPDLAKVKEAIRTLIQFANET